MLNKQEGVILVVIKLTHSQAAATEENLKTVTNPQGMEGVHLEWS